MKKIAVAFSLLICIIICISACNTDISDITQEPSATKALSSTTVLTKSQVTTIKSDITVVTDTVITDTPDTQSKDTPTTGTAFSYSNITTSTPLTQVPVTQIPICVHVDGNKDGVCDNCKNSVIKTVDIYAVNDLHGKFLDSDTQPGVDNLTTYFKDAQKNNKDTVILSSGDMWQGSAESGLTHGNIMTEWMNYVGFASMTLGNHEFDWGIGRIEENCAIADFPILAINVYSEETNKRMGFCAPSTTLDLGEIQVGIIGAIGDCYSSISGEMNDGFYFKTGASLTSLVKEEAEKLRSEGVDFIVYSIHDSTSGYDSALDQYVDIVFEGHSHSTYVENKGVYHLQGGGENSGISYAQIEYNFANNVFEVTEAQTVNKSVYSKSKEDSIVNDLVNKYSDKISFIMSPLGMNDKTKSSSELKQLSSDLYLKAGLEKWGDKYKIALGGGYTSCRSPGKLLAGEVDYGMLYMLFPFDNRLALCSIKGSDLLNRYYNSTDKNYYMAYSEYGESIRGKINSNDTYYIIADSYNFTYSKNKLTVVEYYDDASVFARDLIAQYVKDGGMTQGGVTGLPEKDSHLSAKEVIEAGKKLEANGETPYKYYYTGKVTSIINTKYGNLYVKDSSGDEIYIYGLYLADGTYFQDMENQPKVNDTITIYGAIKRYTGSGETIEFYNAVLITE